MDKVNGKLTVFFEEPFWVGIFERIEDGKLSAAKVTFGAEPKDCEVQEYIQKWYFSLKFSPVVETVVKDIKRNPKRMQREAAGEKKEEKKPDEALTLIYQNLEDRMKSVMGTKVSIHNKDKNKGRIEIEYYSEAELERIVEMIESIG